METSTLTSRSTALLRCDSNDAICGRKQLLVADPEFVRIRAVSRDNAASILRQLERPSLEATIATLASLPADTPCHAPEVWRAIAVQTLVLVNGLDTLHPVEYGHRLAASIPGARLVEIAPKERDPALHAREARQAIEVFVAGLNLEPFAAG